MTLILRLLAIGCLLAGASHVAMGPAADNMLGASLGPEALSNPTLDSQNRFYGAAFMLYGALFWIASADPVRHDLLLRAALGFFFLGGIARLISWWQVGVPAPMAVVLAASELLIPPAIWLWLNRRN